MKVSHGSLAHCLPSSNNVKGDIKKLVLSSSVALASSVNICRSLQEYIWW